MDLRVLIVDDEPLARRRLAALLEELRAGAPMAGWSLGRVGEVGDAAAAWAALATADWDVCLLDIHMPGMDGLALAERLRHSHRPPAVVFVTAHTEHALRAFELEAVDYLGKPVRRERLAQALEKAARWLQARPGLSATEAPDFLLIHDRGRTERVPLDEVVYLKAELKYLTVRTPARSHIYDGSLHELEQRCPARWLRVHRNALVARARLRALERNPDDPDSWLIRLDGVDERLPVSRRQLAQVREVLSQG